MPSHVFQEYDCMKYVALLAVLFVIGSAAEARHNSEHPLSHKDWNEVMEKVALLEGAGLMPTLLPVIMSNRDALQLTDEQLNAFRAWRKNNYTNMVNVMNEIIEKMVEFRVESLSPGITGEQLTCIPVRNTGTAGQASENKAFLQGACHEDLYRRAMG